MADDMDDSKICIEAAYNGSMCVCYILPTVALAEFFNVVREICSFPGDQVFTVKWLDDESDPCTISSQEELEEAFRLYELNKDNKMVLHIFPSIPEGPGMPCPGEDRSMYRKGARRYHKLYRVNGHVFQAKRLHKSAVCSICADKIWGLGMQGFKCVDCKLKVHKRCHKFARCACEAGAAENSFNHVSNVSSRTVGNRRAMTASNDSSGTARPEFSRIPSRVLRPRNRESAVSIANGTPKPNIEPVGPAQAVEGLPGDGKALSLEDFELVRVIGRGSYAKVLVVELKKTKRIYAMKVIKKELIKEDEDIEWVNTEKKVFETASNYPFLVGLHSCFQTPSRLFFIIEFVSGGDLMFHMQRQLKLHEDHARFYSAEIVLALNYLHKRGIIYRDLKLDNVLLDHEGHIKLTDYGMCKEGMLTPEDRTETFCGTPNYIAPEILLGKPYSFSVDWWALGVLLFEMLVGKSPFDLTQTQNPDQNTEDALFQVILERPIRVPRSLKRPAGSVLLGFLNKDPDQRLGCNPETGFTDIVSHVFFKELKFGELEAKHIPPPFKPAVDENDPLHDLHNFDPQFTKEPVQLTPDDKSFIAEIDQSEFDGFEYVNPLLMSSEDSV